MRMLADAHLLPDGTTAHQQGALHGSEQVMGVAGGSRALSAPDLQMLAYQRHLNSKAEAASTAAAADPAGQDPWSCVGDRQAAATAAMKCLQVQLQQHSKLAGRVPASQSTCTRLACQTWLQTLIPAGCIRGVLPTCSPKDMARRGHQEGLRLGTLLPFHVPKRWSLELQRLGSLTSQLLPGKQHGQQHHQQQQQQGPSLLSSHQQQRSHHTRNSSYGMLNLPEEAPL